VFVFDFRIKTIIQCFFNYSIKLTIRRIKKQDYTVIEDSIKKQLNTFFEPHEIEQLARESKFVQRSGLLSGFTFLCLLTINSDDLATESLNDLVTKLELEHGINMKKQSLDERFNQYAVCFLKKAVEELLNKHCSNTVSFMECDQFKRILIKDSVCFQVDASLAEYFPGCGGSGSPATVRIQFEYDLIAGTIVDLSLHGFIEQDAGNSTITLDVVNEGDLIIRDLAYMHITALKGILSRVGDFLCRLQARRKVYQLLDGEIVELDFAGIVQSMEEYQVDKIEEKVLLDEKELLEVRLFIYLLPLDIYRERIRKANLNAKKKGCQYSREFKARARLNLFITSASEDVLDIETAWKAYTLRWQIELGFKVWKSLWKIDKVKKVKKERLECYIWSKLFVIVLSLRVLWITHGQMCSRFGYSLSFYKATKTLISSFRDKLKKVLIGETTSAVQFLMDFLDLSLRRHLREKKKGGNNSPEILFNIFRVRYDGQVISISL